MRSQEKELRTLVVKTDGACGGIGEDGSHGEGSVPSSKVHMVFSFERLESRVPMHKAVS